MPCAPAIEACASLRHVIVVGQDAARRLAGALSFETLVDAASPALEPEPTSPDAPAFWLYSSGSTGQPKGCVHLQHDMKVCADAYARGVLGIHERDRCFSVAKLFFAYGLGNGMYFPFAVGATTILWPGAGRRTDGLRHHRAIPSDAVLLRADALRDAAGAHRAGVGSSICRASARPCPPEKRCRRPLFERFRNRFGIEILDGIGSTEVLHIFISNRPGRVRPGSSGVLVPGYEARLVDEHGQAVPPGEFGRPRSCAAIRPVPSTGTGTSRRRTRSRATGFGRATSTTRMTTASSGSPDARTTCSRSAASG